MQLHQYQAAARRTAKALAPKEAYDHFVMGIISDWGEVVTVIKAVQIYNKPLDAVWNKDKPEKGDTLAHIKEELGDCLWFISNGCDVVGIQLSEVVHHPITDPIYMAYSHMSDGPDYWARTGAMAAGQLAMYARAGHDEEWRIKYDLARFYVCVRQVMLEYKLELEDVMQFNIDKLKKRYPEKYSDELAQKRADV